jgi:hypothetical protein
MTTTKLLNEYTNGNYTVKIFNDGTKIRETQDSQFLAAFPENIDVKITNACNMGCPQCHEDSIPNGIHGNLNQPFFNSLRPGTELAIGGGAAQTHPEFIPFLKSLKEKGLIANFTIHQHHFMQERELVKSLVEQDLIKGIGVSFSHYSDDFVREIQKYPNAIIHVINGYVSYAELSKLFDKNLKLLILGYKMIRRGKDFYNVGVEGKKQILYNNIHKIIKGMKVTCMDNLAIEQLNARRLFTTDEWNEFYMGDDGKFTMFIDLVKEEFASSSTSPLRYKLTDTIDDMFQTVLREKP